MRAGPAAEKEINCGSFDFGRNGAPLYQNKKRIKLNQPFSIPSFVYDKRRVNRNIIKGLGFTVKSTTN